MATFWYELGSLLSCKQLKNFNKYLNNRVYDSISSSHKLNSCYVGDIFVAWQIACTKRQGAISYQSNSIALLCFLFFSLRNCTASSSLSSQWFMVMRHRQWSLAFQPRNISGPHQKFKIYHFQCWQCDCELLRIACSLSYFGCTLNQWILI